jgi:hypothetical protein
MSSVGRRGSCRRGSGSDRKARGQSDGAKTGRRHGRLCRRRAELARAVTNRPHSRKEARNTVQYGHLWFEGDRARPSKRACAEASSAPRPMALRRGEARGFRAGRAGRQGRGARPSAWVGLVFG